VGLLVADDPYATGLADAFTRSYNDLGGERITRVGYSPTAAGFDDEVGQIEAAHPDGIVVIGFGETSRILNELVQRGMGTKNKRTYTVSANTNNTVGDDYEAGK